jgi:DNA-binding response OmpR family regulator
VIWGDSGHAGLRVAECDQPDLVVCETTLPDGSGIDLCRTMKASFFCETPVVLVGKHRDEKLDLPRAVRAGADDYIGSFTDWQLIMAKLEWLIQKRTSNDRSRNRNDVHTISAVVNSLN